MLGTTLYPLNELKYIYPDLYSTTIEKYRGREELLEREVKNLNCRWNDVLHLTAVPPEKIKESLLRAGVNYNESSWFKIPVEILAKEKITVFTYNIAKSDVYDVLEYETFDLIRMPVYQTIPNETIEYYKEDLSLGKDPLTFHLIPHILYKGTLDVSRIEIITI